MGARIASGALWGFLFFLFVALDLVLLGVVSLASALVTVLPLAGLVGGGLLGWVAARSVTPAAGPATYATAAPEFWPTHVVPASGLPAWSAPDPSTPVAAELEPMLPVQVIGWYGDWAQVLCANGWQAWVDGRRLAPHEGRAFGPQPGPSRP